MRSDCHTALFGREYMRHDKGMVQRHGFDRPDLLVAGGNRYDVLQFTKAEWSIRGCEFGPEGVNIHCESRQRGTMRPDIEIEPYESGIDKKPERLDALAPQLELKAKLHRGVRAKMHALAADLPDLGIVLGGLRQPDAPSMCTAVKFDVGLSEDCTPEQHAAFAADMVEAIAPLMDGMAAGLGLSHRRQPGRRSFHRPPNFQ